MSSDCSFQITFDWAPSTPTPLSDFRFFANLFRLYLHATAHHLLVR